MLRRAGAEMERQRGNHQRWIREVNGRFMQFFRQMILLEETCMKGSAGN